MALAFAIPLFVASLVLTLLAARLFARRLDRLGSRFGFPEVVVGLLTALAADGPEISSALTALIRGAPGTSVGVLVGSNVFNLAAMVGLSALLAGGVRMGRASLVVEASLGAAITLLGAAVLLGWLSPSAAAVLAALALAPYVALAVGGIELAIWRRRAAELGRSWARDAGGLASWRPRADQPRAHPRKPAARAPATQSRQAPEISCAQGSATVEGREPEDTAATRPRHDDAEPDDPAHGLLVLIGVDVVLIVAGSVGMVQAALALAGHWHIGRAVLGVLILAPLTSVPNAITAVRLGFAGRGSALVAEAFNSNTINLAVGVIVPALFVTIAAATTTAKLQLAWLLVMTFAAIALLARRGDTRAGAMGATSGTGRTGGTGRSGGMGRSGTMGRAGGGALIVLYLAFVAFTLARS
jgi:cation:H+ antiporter